MTGVLVEYAAQNGQLEILKWMHAHGAALTKYVSKEAAESGHLETLNGVSENMLEYCRRLGIPWGCLDQVGNLIREYVLLGK